MAAANLIDDRVSEKQCTSAIEALLKHVRKTQEKQKFELLGGKEQQVWLVIATKQMHAEKKLKPHRIPIVHPLVDPRNSGICLITKDPQREYKNLLEEKKIRFVSRVVGITKLKGKFKPFEARRLLLKENGLFLADDRVIPLLPSLLGKAFFNAKKQPIPVKLTAKDLKSELERAVNSTYFHQNQGTCASVKIGLPEQKPEQILANLKSALPHIVKAIKGEWDNIQSLSIKTSTSVSLPIWSCNLGNEEGGRWDGLTVKEDVEMGSEEGSDEEVEAEEKSTKKSAAKGKKRAAEEDAVVEKPKKKVKADVADKKESKKESKSSAPESKPSAPADAPKTRKRKGTVSQPSAPVIDTLAPSTSSTDPDVTEAKKTKKRRKTQDTPVEPSTSTPSDPTPAAVPITPTVVRQKKSRASAGDFFEETQTTPAQPTTVAPPPNTPADGLTATPEPSRKARTRSTTRAHAEAAAVAAAVTKLSDEVAEKAAEPAPESDQPAKKPKRKKLRALAAAAAAAEAGTEATPTATDETTAPEPTPSSEAPKKKKKQRHVAAKEAKAAAREAASAPASDGPTVEDVKEKRSVSGAEKKKEKVTKRKRSGGETAKEALLGVKGLTS